MKDNIQGTSEIGPGKCGQASPNTPNYCQMSGPELLEALGDNGYAWAEAFCQIKSMQRWSSDDIDEGLMVAWFANAIEQSTTVREERMLKALRGPTTGVVPRLRQMIFGSQS